MSRPILTRRGQLLATACFVALSLPVAAHAADDTIPPIPAPPSASQPVQQVVTTDNKTALPENIPAVVAEFTAQQIEESVNAFTSAETLKYLPDIEVRERYIGDRNGLIATRTTGTTSGAESIVYADDLLLSNFLGNSYSYPPRWGMVSVPEIQTLDFVYGPFSAVYPGNAMGGVLTMTTKMPDHPTAYVDAKTFMEDFKYYGTKEMNPGFDGSAGFGNKVGDLSYWADFDHMDAQGHPMSFATVSTGGGDGNGLSTGTAAGSITGCGTTKNCVNISNLSGYKVDTDQYGNTRYVFGAYSIDHTIQDQSKLKLAYDITPEVRAIYTLGAWSNNSNEQGQSFTTNSSTGQAFYNGYVDINGKYYQVSSVGPETMQEFHLMNALSVKSDTHGLFDWDLSASKYLYIQDDTRVASTSLYGTTLTGNGGGTDTKMDGTGWETADARGILRLKDMMAGRHEVSFGYHQDGYKLDQFAYTSTTSWQNTEGSLNSASVGSTQTQAVYLQDAYKFLPDWTLTVGGREEFWNATSGANYASSAWTIYPNRTAVNFSPKAALAYQVTSDWAERLSFGKAYRYPTVTELFQTGLTASNAPDLAPEEVWSYDWTSEYTIHQNTTRLSLFEEYRDNAIVSQTNYAVSPNVTGYQNVSKVRMRGIEIADGNKNTLIDGLDVMGNVTYTQATIMDDPEYVAANNKEFPRVPTWRAKLLGVYHQNEQLSYSVGMRYAGKDFSTLNNSDNNGGVYGGISAYFVMDTRVTYKVGNGITLAAGVDNATDDHYFVSPHPYPQITAFGELRYNY